MSYREISSSQILLPGEDTGFSGLGPGIVRRAITQPVRRRPASPWRSRFPSLVAFFLLAIGVGAIAFVVLQPPAPAFTASALPDVGALPSPGGLTAPGRLIDSEPSGALVYRGEDLIGTTPFRYDTPPGSPLGRVRLVLAGYRVEERTIGADAEQMMVVQLRPR